MHSESALGVLQPGMFHDTIESIDFAANYLQAYKRLV